MTEIIACTSDDKKRWELEAILTELESVRQEILRLTTSGPQGVEASAEIVSRFIRLNKAELKALEIKK